MAATSVAAVNTSKEATLIRLLRFPAPLIGLVDSFDPPQLRDQLPRKIAERLCFAGHMVSVEFRIGARSWQDRLSESLTPPLPPAHSAASSRAAPMPSAKRTRDRSGQAP